MNILFVNTFDVSPFLGGTERITDTLCREFRKRCLCRCYLAYYEGIGRCVVMHDAPSFLFITDINRFIFFKLR